MYKFSYVEYVSNGQNINTLSEAKKLSTNFSVLYIPQYEQFAISEKKKKLRRTLKKTLDK